MKVFILSATIYVSRLSAAVREPVIWYVSFPHGEPSVRCPVPVAGGGDASVSMEPEGVTMASSISAAIREVWSLELLQIISLCGWSRIDGSAAIYEP